MCTSCVVGAFGDRTVLIRCFPLEIKSLSTWCAFSVRSLRYVLPQEGKAGALDAFLTHTHKSRIGPTETLEQLLDLEEHGRAAVNLARRTRSACLGAFSRSTGSTEPPQEIDRVEQARSNGYDGYDARQHLAL